MEPPALLPTREKGVLRIFSCFDPLYWLSGILDSHLVVLANSTAVFVEKLTAFLQSRSQLSSLLR
jgi:hypothetical protein